MTLLVLELKVPEVSHHHSDAEMLGQLRDLLPAFFAFVVTFLISGVFWFLHHLTFHYLRHTDRVLCWINLVFLMFVSLLPFSAGLLSHLLVHPISQFFYFGNQLALGIALNVHWHYALRRKMIAPDASPFEVRRITWRIGTLIAGFTAAIAGTLVNPRYSTACLLVTIAVLRIVRRIRERRAAHGI